MAATNLKCRECGTEYALEARYVCERCFGPLEVAYEHARRTTSTALRRRIQGGPQNIWRYADFLPLERARSRARARGLPAGCTPLIRADRLAERLGLREVWVKNDAANPTHSFKDRVVSVAAHRARELGFDVLACASTGNLANSVAAHGAALGHGDLRLHPVRPRGAEDPRDRRLRHEPRQGPRQLRRRQPPLHRAVGRARLGLRQRQHAPVLRRGLEDARLRDRRAARLGDARPRRRADRLRLAVHEDRQGLRGVARARPHQRRRARHERRPGARAARRSPPPSRRAPTSAGRSSPTRSPSRWPSATRPTARTRSSSRAAAAAASTRSPTTRSARASACWPRRPASSPRPPAA